MAANQTTIELCHFCGGQDGCYEKRDEYGSYRACCFACALKGNPVPIQFQQAKAAAKKSGERA